MSAACVGAERARRVIILGCVQDHAKGNYAQNDKIEQRREMMDMALYEGNEQGQQQGRYQDDPVSKIDHKTLNRPEVERRQHKGDEVEIDRA